MKKNCLDFNRGHQHEGGVGGVILSPPQEVSEGRRRQFHFLISYSILSLAQVVTVQVFQQKPVEFL